MTPDEINQKVQKEQMKDQLGKDDLFDENELQIETSKLVDSEIEQNKGDDELDTLSQSPGLLSSSDDSDDSFTRPS